MGCAAGTEDVRSRRRSSIALAGENMSARSSRASPAQSRSRGFFCEWPQELGVAGVMDGRLSENMSASKRSTCPAGVPLADHSVDCNECSMDPKQVELLPGVDVRDTRPGKSLRPKPMSQPEPSGAASKDCARPLRLGLVPPAAQAGSFRRDGELPVADAGREARGVCAFDGDVCR